MFANITRESLKKLLYQKQHTQKKQQQQNTNILDGGFNPLKNISQLGLLFPVWKDKNIFQTTNQFFFVDKPYSWINKP